MIRVKSWGLGVALGLTGLATGCAHTTQQPSTPPVMTLNKQPATGTVQTAANAPAGGATLQQTGGVSSPAYRNLQVANSSPYTGGAQLQSLPNPNTAVVSSSPVTNPNAYGLNPNQPQQSIAYAPNGAGVPQQSVQQAQYPQQAPIRQTPVTQPPLPGSGNGIAMMPPATPLEPTNVPPTGVPSLPPSPSNRSAVSSTPIMATAGTSGPQLTNSDANLERMRMQAPALPVKPDLPILNGGGSSVPALNPTPAMNVPKLPESGPELKLPSNSSSTLPDLDPAVTQPRTGSAITSTPDVVLVRPVNATAPASPAPTLPSPSTPSGSNATKFSELPPTPLFPVPESLQR
ncbi:hypothetical protein KIH39_17145 [Telmatocola sphagniphila]|uniref:Uncharacterized protein n=1 Tax=Telmatocola sphagniphila TaxID=1123043 RepID=A0A8E6B2L9_9BACT|nr:hypothetical protein [Telmatocola sphagniphila]QVL30571.1 hypothetical protein KIH39_17145 [Telmatocola sphagniphila]